MARPLEALVFLLPLILFYEVAAFASENRVIAFDLFRRLLALFGETGAWAPGLGVVAILLATHIASGQDWSVRWAHVGLMYVESVALAVPLLALNWAMRLAAAADRTAVASSLLDRLSLAVGAGIYEELVFRLMVISLIIMLGVDLLRLPVAPVGVAAVALSALAFAAHHHQPIATEPFDVMPFLFRTLAGVYLATIFWFRGYGLAAGCHAAYNLALVLRGVPGA